VPKQRPTYEAPLHHRLTGFWMNHCTVSRRNSPIRVLEREVICPRQISSFANMQAAAKRHSSNAGLFQWTRTAKPANWNCL
jgi:uncharacterized protein (DUF1800 family)